MAIIFACTVVLKDICYAYLPLFLIYKVQLGKVFFQFVKLIFIVLALENVYLETMNSINILHHCFSKNGLMQTISYENESFQSSIHILYAFHLFFIHSFIPLFINSFIHPSIRPSIYRFIHPKLTLCDELKFKRLIDLFLGCHCISTTYNVSKCSSIFRNFKESCWNNRKQCKYE